MEEPGGLLTSLQSSAVDRDEGDVHFRCLSIDAVAEAAGKHGLTTREVSVIALEHGMVPLRYVKNIGTVGLAGQARLLGSRALVVGAGGIGGAACELLARMGLGTIVLVDPDTFDETNLNRQNFCCGAAIGRPKVDVVADRLLEINCDVDVISRRMSADSNTLPTLISGADVVIDALDSLDDRLTLQKACAAAGAVMVHGAIAGTSLQVTTIYPGDTGLEGFVPAGETDERTRGIELETGNPSTTPVLSAVFQVEEAVKVILGIGTTLRGKMLYLDMEDWTLEFIDL